MQNGFEYISAKKKLYESSLDPCTCNKIYQILYPLKNKQMNGRHHPGLKFQGHSLKSKMAEPHPFYNAPRAGDVIVTYNRDNRCMASLVRFSLQTGL